MRPGVRQAVRQAESASDQQERGLSRSLFLPPSQALPRVKKRIGSYPRVRVEGRGRTVVSQAGGVLLVETVRKTGLDQTISAALTPWRRPRAVHDPGKVLLDVALAVALGRDCLGDVGTLRAEPAVFGPVASDPTVSRLVDTLAAAGPRALAAIRTARAQVREHVWKAAGPAAPDADGSVVVDIDGVAGAGPFREAGRRGGLEADVRAPSADGVRRPQPGRRWRTRRGPAAARQRGQQHRE